MKKKRTSLQTHLHRIQPAGGNAVVKKYGKKYMSGLAKKRWAKIKAQKQ